LVVSVGGLPSLLVGGVTHGDVMFELGELESLLENKLSFLLKLKKFLGFFEIMPLFEAEVEVIFLHVINAIFKL
jgi:hypothetical protein